MLQRSLSQVVVGVSDMSAVRELWLRRFGLQAVAGRSGADPELASFWRLQADAIADQLLVRTPGVTAGWLHFVQFAKPGAPVRAGAVPTDLCPKNLDVNCADMPARHAELAAAGCRFRSAISDYEIGALRAREVQMPAHDDVNVVLIEVHDSPLTLSARQFGAVTSFVTTVPDTAAEAQFYRSVLGLDELLQHRITGPAIEQVVGLPSRAALDMRLLGDARQPYGRVELIAYEGLAGRNLYPLAKPPAVGVLGCRFRVHDLPALRARALAAGCAVEEGGRVDFLFGRAEVCTLVSPAGLRIDLYALLDAA